MRQPAVPALALALGVAAAVALASCGGGEDAKLLPGNTAAEITENLDRVQRYAEEGECVGAEDAAAEVADQVEALEGVDPKLVEALRRGSARLGEVVASCQEATTESVSPASEAPSTEEAERIPPGQEKKAEKDREKEEEKLAKEEEKAEKHEAPPSEPTPKEPPAAPAPPASEEGGGTGAPGGVSPGAPVEAGGE